MMKKPIIMFLCIMVCALFLNAAIDNTKAMELINKGYEAFKIYKDASQAFTYYKKAIDLASGYVKASALVGAAYMSHLQGNKIQDFQNFINDALDIDPKMTLEPIDYRASFIEIFNGIKSGGTTAAKPASARPTPVTAPPQPKPVAAKTAPKAAPAQAQLAAAKPTPEKVPAQTQPEVTQPTPETAAAQPPPAEKEPTDEATSEQKPLKGKIGFKIATGLVFPAGSSWSWDDFFGSGVFYGPAFHASIFKKINEKLETSGGVELYMFFGKNKETPDGYYNISSGVRTMSLFVSGRYNLEQAKIFLEGGLGYNSNKITWTNSYDNYQYGKYGQNIMGIRVGGGYKINKYLEAEICANFAGRNTIFMMIGYKNSVL